MTKTINVGDTVKLTSTHLRNTGQFIGSAGMSRWVVTGITPNGWAITNQELDHYATTFGAEELAADPTLKFRRIALGNLERVKTR